MPVGGKSDRRANEAVDVLARAAGEQAHVFPCRARGLFQPACHAEHFRQLASGSLGLRRQLHAFGMGIERRIAQGEVRIRLQPVRLFELGKADLQRSAIARARQEVVYGKAEGHSSYFVIPAKAGTQRETADTPIWIPACAGMTNRGVSGVCSLLMAGKPNPARRPPPVRRYWRSPCPASFRVAGRPIPRRWSSRW